MLATSGAVQDVMVRQDVLAAIRTDGVWAQMGTIGVDATGSLMVKSGINAWWLIPALAVATTAVSLERRRADTH